MATKCTYEYFDKDGNPSKEYLINKESLGEDIAHAIFITNNLKNDSGVKSSISIDNDAKLREKHNYSDLSKKGYVGATTVIDKSKSADSDLKILNNMALNIKIREQLMALPDKYVNPDHFVYINDHKKIEEVAKQVKEDYFGYDTVNLKVTKNETEFNALKVDAAALKNMQVNKGDLVHLLFQHIFLARAAYPAGKIPSFNTYFSDAVINYKLAASSGENSKKFPDGANLSPDVIVSIKQVAEKLVEQVAALNAEYQTDDFELLPELSIFTDKVKYANNPLQGHIDLLIYSKSKKLGYIIDYKTKSEQSFSNYDDTFGRMSYPFDTMGQSAQNKTVIQTGIYEVILNQEYGITVIGKDVLLITGKYSDGSTNENKEDKKIIAGNRKWKMYQIDQAKTVREKLDSVKGLLHDLFNIEEMPVLGTKSSDTIIDTMFQGKLVTTVSSKMNYVYGQESKIEQLPDGRYKWYNSHDNKKSINKATKKEVLHELESVYDDLMETKKNAAADLVTFFEKNTTKNSIWNNTHYKNKAIEMLQMFKPGTHTLESHVQIPGLSKDIIVATNLLTKEVTLISIADVYNSAYNFSETTAEGAKTTIYGTLMEDASVNKKYGKHKIPAADTHSLSHLRLAILAAELQTKNPAKYGSINMLLSTALKNDSPYSYSEVAIQVGYIKEMVAIAKKNGTPIDTELLVIANNPELSGPNAFKINYFENFAQEFGKMLDPLSRLVSSNTIGAYDVKRQKAAITEALRLYHEERFHFGTYPKIEKALFEYVQTVFGAVLAKEGTIENVYSNAHFIAANRAWLSFKGWMVTENPSFRKQSLGQLNSLVTTGDRSAQNLHLAISEYEQRSRDEILNIMNEHQVLQKALLDDSKDASLLSNVFDPNLFKKIFAPMLVDGYNFSEDKVDSWMQFKDPDNMALNLSPAQRNYIRFYEKIVRQSSNILFHGNYKTMYPDSESEVYEIKKWNKNGIPIISATEGLNLKDISFTVGGMDSSLEVIKKILNRNSKSQTEESKDVMQPWNYSVMFPEQVDNAPGKGSRDSRSLLNVSDDNTVIENKQNIELNPITVLNIMLVEAAKKNHMKIAAFAAFSMNAELAAKELYPGVNTKQLRELTTSIAMMRIQGKVEEEGTFGKILDTTKTLTGMALFWSSLSQMATETLTSTAQLTSQMFANGINTYLFRGNNKYDNKDTLWAAKHMNSKLGSQIIVDNGMFNTTLGQFTDSQYDETRKKFMWQSKHGFWFVRNVLRQSTSVIVLAQMHKEGITEKCFKLNEDTGKYSYDETADSRFYVYDDVNPFPGQGSRPTSDEDIAKNKFWKTHRDILAKEGGLDSEGKMTRPFIMKQMQAIKNYAVRLIGSMDSSEVMGIEVHALGRAVTTFQRWMRQKITNYTGKSEGKTFREGKWIVDTEGNHNWVEEDFEGIFQSVAGLYRDISQEGFMNGIKGMSDVRKVQLSKLLADLLLVAILLYLATLMKNTEKEFGGGASGGAGAGSSWGNSLVGKELNKGIVNASSDMFPIVALGNTLTGSSMPAVSVAVNMIKNMKRTLGYSLTGDLENALSSADKTMSTIGSYRAGKVFLNTMVDFETDKQSK